jgi:NAD(P)-dependent dehydrogenase (short-subunit alcohol dehydrogenase family)
MTVLIVGASGATGQLLVAELLARGLGVKAVVRSADRLPDNLRQHPALNVVETNLLELGDAEVQKLARGCEAIACCLGHNLTFKGILGAPRDLVTRSVRRLCAAVQVLQPTVPVRFVLMNTVAVRNRDLDEPASLGHRAVIGLLRLLLPPHTDNENAADVLRTEVGQDNKAIQWSAVRPDSLTTVASASEYELHPSTTRDCIVDPGKTTRNNVAHFMAGLITDDTLWNTWKGRMPVIYNKGFSQPKSKGTGGN